MIQFVQNWRPMWAWIRAGLEEIIKRTHPTWIPEDVYTELKSGHAFLATVADDAGFLILKRLQDYDGQVLFVWCLHGDVAQFNDEAHAELRSIARNAGCVRLQMRSPRKGWARVGWNERETVYEMEA